MGFFTLSNGDSANNGQKEFENGGNFDPIPDNTTVLAAISKIEWAGPTEYYPVDVIKTVWDVLEPKEYSGRKIRQAIKIYDQDRAKADKAKTMLAVIDNIAGGKVMAHCERTGTEPDDNILASCLINKPMLVTLGLMTPKEADKTPFNWIRKVAERVRGGQSPAATQTRQTPAAPVETPAQRQARLRAERVQQAPAPVVDDKDLDDDIPF